MTAESLLKLNNLTTANRQTEEKHGSILFFIFFSFRSTNSHNDDYRGSGRDQTRREGITREKIDEKVLSLSGKKS